MHGYCRLLKEGFMIVLSFATENNNATAISKYCTQFAFVSEILRCGNFSPGLFPLLSHYMCINFSSFFPQGKAHKA